LPDIRGCDSPDITGRRSWSLIADRWLGSFGGLNPGSSKSIMRAFSIYYIRRLRILRDISLQHDHVPAHARICCRLSHPCGPENSP
jgi:hypothetical protein